MKTLVTILLACALFCTSEVLDTSKIGDSTLFLAKPGKIRFVIDSGEASQKFSVQVFKDGKAVGVNWNSNITDTSGKANVTVKDVDSSICETTSDKVFDAKVHKFYIRLNTGTASDYQKSPNCTSSANNGVLIDAEKIYSSTVYVDGDQTINISSTDFTTAVSQTLAVDVSSSGATATDNKILCYVFDSDTEASFANISNALHYWKNNASGDAVNLGDGTPIGGSTPTTNRRNLVNGIQYKYFCGEDVNDDGAITKAGGDKKASGNITYDGTSTAITVFEGL